MLDSYYNLTPIEYVYFIKEKQFITYPYLDTPRNMYYPCVTVKFGSDWKYYEFEVYVKDREVAQKLAEFLAKEMRDRDRSVIDGILNNLKRDLGSILDAKTRI